jgi:type I restriction enzyme M protein
MARGRPKKSTDGAAQATPAKGNGNGATLGFEAQLFLAAEKLRKNLEPSDYKHVALGLIFLKHISIAFEAKRTKLLFEPTAVSHQDGTIRVVVARLADGDGATLTSQDPA